MDENVRLVLFNLGGFYTLIGTLIGGVVGWALGLLGGMMMGHVVFEWMWWREEWTRLNAAFARAMTARGRR